jgi:peptidoglycan/LPS O-acetylase OafA/YrhL
MASAGRRSHGLVGERRAVTASALGRRVNGTPTSVLSGAVTSANEETLGYRPALDGIRAVAVLAVIAYHFGYRWAPGGFLGVDVFFVLSGYLITSLLLVEHARTGRIALRQFWLRRARRLLPALFLMLIAVSIWIGFYAARFELPTRRDDLLWTLFYGSNWHLIQSGQDYFAQFASVSPLRHTWSLAIEEQFYIVWPLLVSGALWIVRRRPAVLAAVCVVGIGVSGVAMAVLFDPGDPSRAYYGTDTRMHQLMIGALLAVLMSRREVRARFRRATGAIAVLSAVALLAAFATVQDQGAAYYRGLSILVAVTTATLVWATELNPRSVVARVLSLRPVAWVGQISYGLYLWHWPVILAIASAPAPPVSLPGATTGLNLTRLAVTFGVVIVSFYLVEQPIRRGRMPVIGRSARRFAIATVAATVLVAGTILTFTRVDQPRAVDTATLAHGVETSELECQELTICLRHQGPAGAPVFAVVGDSMARSLDPAFESMSVAHGWTYILEATDGCRATHLRAATTGPSDDSKISLCYERMPALQDQLVAKWRPTVIVVADLMDTLGVADSEGHQFAGGAEPNVALTEPATLDLLRRLTVSGAKVALLDLPPQLSSACMKPSEMDGPNCRVLVTSDPSYARYTAMYERVTRQVRGASVISVTPAVCPGGTCGPVVGGIVVRSDGLHFTADGAMLIAPLLQEQILSTGGL